MKKSLYMIVCLAVSFSLIGCTSSTDKEIEKPPVEENKENENNLYAENVSEYFFSDDFYHLYHGYGEAGFEVHFDGIEEENDSLKYKYTGIMNDQRSDNTDRTFIATYTIADEMVIEHVENNDSISDNKNNVYSQIQDFVVLDGEIKEGNSWQQSVVFGGEQMTAKTTITHMDESSFTTVTEIEADGYKDGKYTEERTYTKGSGLTSFSNTPYGSDVDDMLIFGYGYSIANDKSIAELNWY